jgi:uncharacterized protein (DUF433 family)
MSDVKLLARITFDRKIPCGKPTIRGLRTSFEITSILHPRGRAMATLTDIGTLIEQTAGICGGRPRIAGTGVSVRTIAGWYKMGMTPEEISGEYPHVNLAQVHAALAYYHANRDEIDAQMAAEDAEAERLEREHREVRKKP